MADNKAVHFVTDAELVSYTPETKLTYYAHRYTVTFAFPEDENGEYVVDLDDAFEFLDVLNGTKPGLSLDGVYPECYYRYEDQTVVFRASNVFRYYEEDNTWEADGEFSLAEVVNYIKAKFPDVVLTVTQSYHQEFDGTKTFTL